jgi:hypothetical protein
VAASLYLLSFLFLFNGFRRALGDLRVALVCATIPLSLFVVAATEGLSVFHQLARGPVTIGWVAFAVATFLWMQKQRGDALYKSPGAWEHVRLLAKEDQVALACVGIGVGLVACAAIFSAPNTWDAMEYHMPRVFEWITNRGVQLYPTPDRQQLSMPALAEYTILHLQLLAGSDRLANLVQWFAYAGSIVAVTLIVRELGGSRRAQVLAAVFGATIQTGVLGASGTKNDYVLAYWVAVTAYFLLRWRERQDWNETLAIACSLALAVFSKGTAYIYLPPVMLVCFLMWDRKAQGQFLLRLPLLAVLCVAVNGPLWVRCYEFSGSPLGLPYFDGAGPEMGRMYGNQYITPVRSLANVVRNLALHVATPSRKLNGLMLRGFSATVRALGVDPNDYHQMVRSQDGDAAPFDIQWNPLNEVQAGNPLHFFLMLAAGALLIAYAKRFGKRVWLFGAGVVASFVMYATVLRWSPWNARYQLTVFVLGAAFSALVMERVLSRRAVTVVAFAVLVLSLPFAVFTLSRPLVPKGKIKSLLSQSRDETYFNDYHHQFAADWIRAAKATQAKSCRTIGIDARENRYEYPMMALISEDGVPRKIRYVDVGNSTVKYQPADAEPPCVVVCLGCTGIAAKSEMYGPQFQMAETFGNVVVFSEPVAGNNGAAISGK